MTRPIADRDSAPWWAALTEHRLLLQICSNCATARLVPRAMCNGCGAFDWSWQEASGEATVVSWTVSHRTVIPDRPAPYVVVLVRLAEAPNLIMPGGWADTADGTGLAVGLPVRIDYADLAVNDGDPPATLVNWRPAPASQASACTRSVHT